MLAFRRLSVSVVVFSVVLAELRELLLLLRCSFPAEWFSRSVLHVYISNIFDMSFKLFWNLGF